MWTRPKVKNIFKSKTDKRKEQYVGCLCEGEWVGFSHDGRSAIGIEFRWDPIVIKGTFNGWRRERCGGLQYSRGGFTPLLLNQLAVDTYSPHILEYLDNEIFISRLARNLKKKINEFSKISPPLESFL